MEFEELFYLQCWETGNKIKYDGKTIFNKKEAGDIFCLLNEAQQERFRIVSAEEAVYSKYVTLVK